MATMSARQCTVSRQAVARRSAVVVRASAEPAVDRRALLGAFAAALGAASSLVAPQEASARKIASQSFTGGMVSGGGAVPKSATLATSEGYTMEGFPGTKKPSYVTPSQRKKLLDRTRAQAEALTKK